MELHSSPVSSQRLNRLGVAQEDMRGGIVRIGAASVVEQPGGSKPRADAGEVYVSVDDPEHQTEQAEHEGGRHVADR